MLHSLCGHFSIYFRISSLGSEFKLRENIFNGFEFIVNFNNLVCVQHFSLESVCSIGSLWEIVVKVSLFL